MNAIDFILKEHKKIRKTFVKIKRKAAQEATQKRMFNTFAKFLASHEKMEQTKWYPQLRKNQKLRSRIKHLITEEKTAGKAIKKMKKLKQKEWEKKFLKLKKDVDHHAREEEKKLFLKVRKLIDHAELNKIGKQLSAFRRRHKN